MAIVLAGQKTTGTEFSNIVAPKVGDQVSLSSTTVGAGTESIHISRTFVAVTGGEYMAMWVGSVAGTNVGTSIRTRMRYTAGGSASTAGTQIAVRQAIVAVANAAIPTSLRKAFIPGSGNFTVGISIDLQSGAGTVSILGIAGLEESYLDICRVN